MKTVMSACEYRMMVKNIIVPKKNAIKKIIKVSQEKAWLDFNVAIWAKERGLTFEKEFRFSTERKFRADGVIHEMRILIEYEGIFSAKSGHTTPDGFMSDCEKYNLAVIEGYRVIRYHAKNYKHIINDLNRIHERYFGGSE